MATGFCGTLVGSFVKHLSIVSSQNFIRINPMFGNETCSAILATSTLKARTAKAWARAEFLSNKVQTKFS